MERVDPGFMREMQKLGGFDATACYSCGNCTATCPLSEGGYSFPRKMVRYTMLGLKDRIRRSPELWLCDYCGECSDTCPREADPGALMMALRRYSISQTSLGRLAGLFYHKTLSWILWILLTACASAGLFFVSNPSPNLEKAVPLSFISLNFLHDFGIAIGIFLFLVVSFQVIRLAGSLRLQGEKTGLALKVRGLFTTLVQEVAFQKDLQKCDRKGRYVAHLAVFWGFLGLFLATVVVFGVDFFGFPGLFRVAARVVGILSGAVLIYGCLYFILERLRAKDSYSKYSHPSDWVFLWLLFLGGLTGFVLDIFMYLNLPWPTYVAFAVHLVFVFDLLVTFPFTKFAHAMYRPLAVWLSGEKNGSGQAGK
jgi:heterodisulfide reductase subunit C